MSTEYHFTLLGHAAVTVSLVRGTSRVMKIPLMLAKTIVGT